MMDSLLFMALPLLPSTSMTSKEFDAEKAPVQMVETVAARMEKEKAILNRCYCCSCDGNDANTAAADLLSWRRKRRTRENGNRTCVRPIECERQKMENDEQDWQQYRWRSVKVHQRPESVERKKKDWKRPTELDRLLARKCARNCSPAPILFFLFLIISMLNDAQAIRCYCTDEHCVPYGVCESNVCLVGLLRANNAVIRTCGNQPLGCQRNVDRWSYLCSCNDNFCNTFLFLKASTNIDGPRSRSPPSSSLDSGGINNPVGEHRVFERVDSSPGDFATFDHASGDDEDGPAPIKNSSLLTLLLVIVPLTVGASAVLVIAINYYCHLC